LCLLLGSGLSVVQPYLTKIAIDRYIRNNDFTGLHQIAILYILSLIFVFALSFGQTWLINLMGQKIMRDLRMEIFRRLQNLDVSFFDKNPVGRLMTRVTTDVDALNELFTAGVISVSKTYSCFPESSFHSFCSITNLPSQSLLFFRSSSLLLYCQDKVLDSYRRVGLLCAYQLIPSENITSGRRQIFGRGEKTVSAIHTYQ
jgi:ABC-type multidrug transport system fused ATPase/permease subunit